MQILSKIGNRFEFEGAKLFYFLHPYNKTWRNERSIEIPIAKFLTKDYEGNMLEIGNVIQHYYGHQDGHDIIDKYETAPFVMNVDALKFIPEKKYKKVVAISTIEHFSEKSDDPEKGIKGIEKLKSFVAPGGILVFTIPAGWDKVLDAELFSLDLDIYTLKKTEYGLWKQCCPSDLRGIKYDYEGYSARGLYVCVWKNILFDYRYRF